MIDAVLLCPFCKEPLIEFRIIDAVESWSIYDLDLGEYRQGDIHDNTRSTCLRCEACDGMLDGTPAGAWAYEQAKR